MDGAVGIVFNKSHDAVLLIKRRDVPVWVFPGGGIEKNETPEKAVVREVFEETGYKTKIVRKTAEYVYKDSDKINFFFDCRIISGQPTLGSETKDIEFFDVGNLPELKHPGISEWLNDALQNKKTVRKVVKPVSNFAVLSQIFKHPVPVLRYFLLKIGLRINT